MLHQAPIAPILLEDSTHSESSAIGATGDEDVQMLGAVTLQHRTGLTPSRESHAGVASRAADRSRPALRGASILERYFRDIGKTQVMNAEQELQAALAVEQAEIAHWVALLSCVPIAVPVLDELDAHLRPLSEDERLEVPQIEALRELARRWVPRNELTLRQDCRWEALSRELARIVRQLDLDRLWMAEAKALVQAIVRNVSLTNHDDDCDSTACRCLMRSVRETDLEQTRVKHRVVEANLRLVIHVARQYGGSSLPLIDVIQEGNIGLMKAVERFNPSRGFRFSTFAFWWIRHAISRAVACTGRAVRVPSHTLRACASASRATAAFVARTGREPTHEELERQTKMLGNKLNRIMKLQSRPPLSLDREPGNDPGLRLLEFLTDDEQNSPYELVVAETQSIKIHQLLRALPPAESHIVQSRFGFGDENELSLRQIAEEFRVTHEAIRQRLDRVLRKLRRQWGE